MSATAILHRWTDIPAEPVTPSITRRYIAADRVTVAQFELKQGGFVPHHSHEHEQVTMASFPKALVWAENVQARPRPLPRQALVVARRLLPRRLR